MAQSVFQQVLQVVLVFSRGRAIDDDELILQELLAGAKHSIVVRQALEDHVHAVDVTDYQFMLQA